MRCLFTSGRDADEPLRLRESTALSGTLAGEIIVPSGITLVLRGVARSDVIVEKGGRAIIHGRVLGCLINLGGEVEVFGTVETIADAPGVSTRVHSDAVVFTQSSPELPS